MKSVLVYLLLLVNCISFNQKESDLDQILSIILNDANRFASSYHTYHATKKFVVAKLSKADRDITAISSIDWKDDKQVPKEAGWKELANKAADIKSQTDLIFKLGQTGEFSLISIQESDGLKKEDIDGLISISELTFNEQRNKAVLYVTFICGGECGYGNLYFFTKNAEKWEKIGEKGFWVA